MRVKERELMNYALLFVVFVVFIWLYTDSILTSCPQRGINEKFSHAHEGNI